ncbi:hypothetical protein BDR07DRAFT_1303298, partial [Suillus spraguei]
LKGDIVKVLQYVECLLHHDLLFHEPGPSSLTEVETDDFNNDVETGEVADGNDDEACDEQILDDRDDTDINSVDEIR